MKKILLLTAAALVSFACFLKPPVQPQPNKPKLIIGIVVDQMRADFIDRYWSKFGEGGFKRLVEKGYVCRNANFNYVPTYTGPGHASVYTGCTPSGHGIIGNNWYVKETGKYIYCVEDPSVNAVGGRESYGHMSPKNMLCNSFADQLKMENKESKVIGISLKDRGAILPAGHQANAAYWLDGYTGHWMSSTYYMKALPQWVNEFNNLGLAKSYNSKVWTTLLPLDQYTESIKDDNKYEGKFPGETTSAFPHDMPSISAKAGPGIVRSTPWGNTLTKDFAIQTIKSENLGKGNVTDMLAVSFSSTDIVGHMYGPHSIEVQDTYLRLDRDLEELLKFIDLWFKKDEVLIFLTADHGAVDNPGYLLDNGKQGGYMDDTKLKDTLRAALYNTYGDSLVKAYVNQMVYLDHPVITARGLDPNTVNKKVSEVVKQVRGVESTVTRTDLMNKDIKTGIALFVKNGFHDSRSGDVYVNYKEGWIEYGYTGTTHGSCYGYDIHVPLLWYGWKITPGSTSEPVAIPDIVATLSKLTGIKAPKEAWGKPVPGLVK